MHAQLVQYNNTVYLKKIKNVIFLTKLHRKINKTGEVSTSNIFLPIRVLIANNQTCEL